MNQGSHNSYICEPGFMELLGLWLPYKSRKDHALYMRKWRRRKAREEGRVIEPRYETRKYRTKRARPKRKRRNK